MSFDNQTPNVSNQLPISSDFPIKDKELKQMVDDTYSRIVTAVNTKIGGLYQPIETATFQEFYITNTQSSQDVYRTTIDFGPLPNTSVDRISHNLDVNDNFTLVKIYGAASDQDDLTYIPLPFASPVLIENISLSMDSEDVIIQTGSDRSNYKTSYVIIEYTKG